MKHLISKKSSDSKQFLVRISSFRILPWTRDKIEKPWKDEMRNLRKEYLHAQEEVKRIQSIIETVE